MTINVELLAANDIEQLLNQLGGIKRVAQEFGVTTQAVSNWIVRGIPQSRWMDILRLIARANVKGGQITWRPFGWDPHFKISYDCDIAA